jgi:hypothetical protein
MMEYYDKQWNMNYEHLVEFKRKYGHCMVPSKYEQDESLGSWVGHQRHRHAKNKLRPDRTRILNEIGFVWAVERISNTNDKLWHQQHEQLVEFKRENGHCMVPTYYKQDKSLKEWVTTQRSNHGNNKIRPDRRKLLDELGFAWKPEGWDQQYEKLVEFKHKKGHCMVPHRYEQDKFLGRWVNRQRTFHKNNKMQPDREKLLDKIGFVWNVRTLAVRSSSTDVRGLVIGSFHALGRSHVSHSRSFPAYLCRLWSRMLSPALWVSQTKHHQKNRNHQKAA